MVFLALSCIVLLAGCATSLRAQEEQGAEQVLGLEVVFERSSGALELGRAPEEPRWGAWRRGEPITLGAADAPACTLLALYPAPKLHSAGQLAGDADYLASLQRRFGERGVRVVIAFTDLELPVPPSLSACSLVEDPEQRTAIAWGVSYPTAHVVLVDQAGNTVFQGGLEGDVRDALERAIDGTFAVAAAREHATSRRFVVGNYELIAEPELLAHVQRLSQHSPHDGLLLGLAYAAASFLGQREMAAGVQQQALAALRDEPRPLAVFADLALRSDARNAGLATALAGVMRPLVAGASQDPTVQLAFLRALVLAGQGREVGRQVAKMRKVVQNTAEGRLAFAEILLQDAIPVVHKDLVQQVLQEAPEVDPPASWVATRYLYELRCAEDPAAAKAVLDRFVDQVGGGVALNNACWYLMTEPSTAGRYTTFALALAERMLEEKDTLDPFCLDTAALALFLAGRPGEAAELQGLAIQRSGGPNPEYAARRARYEAAAAGAPR